MKNRITAIFIAAMMTLSLTACGNEETSSEQETTSESTQSQSGADDTSAEETQEAADESAQSEWDELSAEEITEAMGIGWNLGNQLEASSNKVPDETAWGNPVITKELIEMIKEQGFNTIRIPVSYLSKIGEAPDYTIDEAWLDRINEVVDYAIDSGLYVIMNIHGDGYYTVDGGWLLCAEDETAQVEIKAKYEKVWEQIAERYKDYDEHLIFESMNEEFNNDYGNPDAEAYENINAYNQIFIDTVRSSGGNNDKRWVLIPGWNTNIGYTTESKGFVIPTDDNCTADGNRIMISVHYYDPYNFTLDENASSATTEWGKYADENYDNWGQEDYANSQFKKLYDEYVSKGYPVVIGEMGCLDKSHLSDNNTAYRAYWYEYIVHSMKENGCVPVMWDNGWTGKGSFAFFDRTTLETTQPEIIEAVMRAMNTDGDYEIPAPEETTQAEEESSETEETTKADV